MRHPALFVKERTRRQDANNLGHVLPDLLSRRDEPERVGLYRQELPPPSPASPSSARPRPPYSSGHGPFGAEPRGYAAYQLCYRDGVSDLVRCSGYLLTLYSTFVVALVLSFSILSGWIGATIIFWFVVKFLLAHERELDPADYNRIGVLARVTSPIGAGGTGEITFSQAGSRNTCGARNETGEPLARGAEVVIIRYEHGIAYVRPWDELAKGTDFAADTAAHEVALKLKS